MREFIIHTPTSQEVICECKSFNIDTSTIVIDIKEDIHTIFPYCKDRKYYSSDWERFFKECILHFVYNNREYSAQIIPSFIPILRGAQELKLHNIQIIDNEMQNSKFLFPIRHLQLHLPCCTPNMTSPLNPFQYNGNKWRLCKAKFANNNWHLYLDKDKEGYKDCWDGACLYLEKPLEANYKAVWQDACNLCWMLSLWCGKYVMWNESYVYGDDDSSWHFIEKTSAANSTQKATIPVHATCDSTMFIERIATRFNEQCGSWRYTIHWLTLALALSDAGSISMILSMLYERLVTAIYCGHDNVTYTEGKSFLSRAQLCKEIGEALYPDTLISEIIDQRNNAMHGSDIVQIKSENFPKYLLNTIKINYCTILSLLGYTGGFTIDRSFSLPEEIYNNTQALSQCPLFFSYTYKRPTAK